MTTDLTNERRRGRPAGGEPMSSAPKDVAFRVRYATEEAARALTEFAAAYGEAVRAELARLAEARRAESERREAEYQAWRSQQEGSTR